LKLRHTTRSKTIRINEVAGQDFKRLICYRLFVQKGSG
jgi:hypothetical protein